MAYLQKELSSIVKFRFESKFHFWLFVTKPKYEGTNRHFSS